MRRASYFAIVAFAAIFFAPELFGGRVATTANMHRWRPWLETATVSQRAAPAHNPDSNLSYYPRRWLLHEAWRERELPLWNVWSFAGTPLLADPQAGVLYPPNWILAALDPKLAVGFFLFLHVAWGGVGAALLLRRQSVRADVAMLGGCAFVLNGFFVKHFGQPAFLAAAAWLPWVMVAAQDVVARPDRRAIARLALVGAGTFLAGQPQIALYGAYAAAVVALVTALRRGRERRAVLFAFAAAGALALLLVAAQLLPTLELARRSARADLPWSTVASGAFHAVDAVRFGVEEFFGTPLTGDEWAFIFPRADGFYLRTQLNSFFVGTPVFLLALHGMTSSRTRSACAPFTALFFAAAAIAFGTPLARAAYEFLPGFDFARLDRAGALLVIAQIVPAGLAANDLATRGGRSLRAKGIGVALLAVGGAVAAAGVGDDWARRLSVEAGLFERLPGRVAAAATFAALTGLAWWLAPSRVAALSGFGLAVVQLTFFAAPYRGDRRPEEVFAPAPGIETLRAVLDADAAHGGGRLLRFGRDLPVRPYPTSSVLPPSTNVPYRLRDLQGYNALSDRTLGETLERATKESLFSDGIWTGRRIVEPERSASLEHPLLDALAVRAVVGAELPRASGWTEIPCEGFRLAINDEALPRFRLVRAGRGVTPETWDDMLATRRMTPREEVIWLGEGVVEAPRTDAAASELEVLEDSWNRVAVRTRTDREAVLVVADAYDAGWRTTIDGVPAPLLRAWGVVRGVRVPAGNHVVEMSYRPRSVVVGIFATLVGFLAVAALLGSVRPRVNSRAAGTL